MKGKNRATAEGHPCRRWAYLPVGLRRNMESLPFRSWHSLPSGFPFLAECCLFLITKAAQILHPMPHENGTGFASASSLKQWCPRLKQATESLDQHRLLLSWKTLRIRNAEGQRLAKDNFWRMKKFVVGKIRQDWLGLIYQRVKRGKETKPQAFRHINSFPGFIATTILSLLG